MTILLGLYTATVCVCVCVCAVWHKAAQGLYLAGFVLLLLTLLIACVNVCCGCCIKSTSLPSFAGFLVLFGCQYRAVIFSQQSDIN